MNKYSQYGGRNGFDGIRMDSIRRVEVSTGARKKVETLKRQR